MKLFASLKRRNKILLGLGLALIVIWGYYNIFYLPNLKDVRTLQREIDNLQTIIKTMKDAGVTTVDSSTDKFRLRLREKELSMLKDMLKQREERFLEKEALSSCLSELTGLCNKSKIEVAFFAPHPDKEAASGGLYKGIPVEINIHTTWGDLINFLEEVQNLPALAILKDIDVRVDKDRPPCIGGKLILELWLRD